MHSRNILILLVVLLIAGVGSLFLGSAVASSDFNTIGIFIGGTLAISLYILLGRNIWILIPIFAVWQGNIQVLPIPFSVNNLMVGFAVFCWIINILTRRESLRYNFTALDGVIGVMIIVLIIGYVRNPVSLSILGGSSAGARPYFEIGMALMAYVMLSSTRIDKAWINRVPYITVVLCVVLAVGGAIAYFLPNIGLYLYRIYTGFMPNMRELDTSGQSVGLEVTRAGYLNPLAMTIVAILYASRAPLANLSPRNPLRIVALGIALLCTLLSGFRGVLGAQAAYFTIASWVWWRGKGFVLTAVLATGTILCVFVISMIFELPLGVQRSLSFLPGDWDQQLVANTETSNDFRLDLWQRAWYEGGIEDVWLGDGFRVPVRELEYQQAQMAAGYVKAEAKITYYLITGDLHSGPLSTIKYIGVVGLFVFMILCITIAYRAYKLWNYAIRNNSDLMIGYFVLPMIYFPVLYIFVFGSFRVDLPRVLVSAGLLVLLTNVIKDMQSSKLEKEPEIGTDD